MGKELLCLVYGGVRDMERETSPIMLRASFIRGVSVMTISLNLQYQMFKPEARFTAFYRV